MNTFDSAVAAALLPLPLTLVASLIDLRRRIIPDVLNLAIFVLGIGVAVLRDPTPATGVASVVQAACAFGLFWSLRAGYARLRGRTGLGLGDVKFIAAATAWIGLAGMPLLILVASTTALTAVALAALAGKPIDGRFRLPFAPFLALGLHAALLAGHAP